MDCEVTEVTEASHEAMATYSLCSEVAEGLFAALRAGGRELPVLKKVAFIEDVWCLVRIGNWDEHG